MSRLKLNLFICPMAVFICAMMGYRQAHAVEIPPTPTAHYYGDADGNVSINLSDIAQHTAYSSFRPCTYDTLQPQTSGQYWNTCDVDGNRSCNLSDIAILNSYTSFKPVSLGGDPWVLENVNLPLTGNAPNTWIPFNINLYMTNSGQPSGRPGISVIAEIDPTSPGHGQLSGRSCTPVAGTRDQLAIAGAQCALAVTITDWQAGQEGLGLTESGTYGFQVWGDGDGDIKIDFHIEQLTAMDIPSVTLSQTVSFTPAATVWYVDDSSPGPVHDGTSWATAFLTVQEGVDAALAGEQVWVAEGTYSTGTATSVLTMKTGVDVYGGFVGTEIRISQRGYPPDHPTILDGLNATSQVVRGSSNAILDGFIVQNGLSNGMSNSGLTGLEILNCSFVDNTRGIYNMNSGIVVRNCMFSGGDNPGSGGAIYNAGCTIEFINCVFRDNTANIGGGLFNTISSLTITNCTFTANTANYGGALYNNNSSPVITNSILWGDTSANEPELYNDGTSNPIITYSDIAGGYSGTGNIDTDPLFAGYPDLHLQPLSPCADTGTASGAPTADLEGTLRPSGYGYDMGAYEYLWGPQCSDGLDNDGDTLIDWPDDPDCTDINDPFEIPCLLDLQCPADVDENAAISCPVIYNLVCTDTLSLGPADDCTGSTVTDNGDFTGSYDAPAQGEAAGSSCRAEVQLAGDGLTDYDVITINEINQDPTISVDCPAGVNEDTATSCALSVSDPDLPPQNLICSLNPPPQTQVNIGTGTSTSFQYPIETSFKVERTQLIYLASEIGVAGTITSLALEVSGVPGQAMNNFTIRVKHTNMDLYFIPYAWEGPSSGWTTVFQDNVTIPSTGWYSFNFTTPFEYNGIQNLMVDFSFNDSTTATSGRVKGFYSPVKRVLYDATSSNYGDPLLWIGTGNPTPYTSVYMPNIRLWVDTQCSGLVLNGCTSIDIPAQGEDNQSSCSVYVSVSDDFAPPGTAQASDTISILEVNQDPTLTVNCPANVGENTATTCPLTVSDGDLPLQVLSCSVDASTTCTGVTVTGCTQADVPAQGEGPNPRTCDLAINVQDDFTPPGSAQVANTITIDEDNADPAWVLPPADIMVRTDEVYSRINGHAMDLDEPVQSLTCSKTSQTCSFNVTVSGEGSGEVDCNFSFTSPGVPEQCEVDIEVADGAGGVLADTVPINAAIVWYVDDTATGANNGTSWTDAFNKIQDAVDAASAGDMIWVAEGIYTNGLAFRDPVLTMKDGVNIYGGFAGTETSLSERGDPMDNQTILDGDDSSCHVILGSSYATIDGFSVMRGNAFVCTEIPYDPYCINFCSSPNDPWDCRGGGMLNYGVNDLTVSNCIFVDNKSYLNGGGMYNINSSPKITDCRFLYNTASWYSYNSVKGGGVVNKNGAPYFLNCIIWGNRAPNAGGMLNVSASPTIVNSLLAINNSVFTYYYDAGILNNISSPNVINTTFTGNRGYAIGNINGSFPVISNSILWGNNEGSPQEQIRNSGSSPTVTFSDVELGYPGSGNIDADPLFIGDPLYSGTWTALPVFNSSLQITTFTDDSQSWAPSTLKGHFLNPDTYYYWRWSIILDNTSTTVTVLGNAKFSISAGTAYKIADYHIGSSSPCKDAGTPTGAPSNDLDGNPRPVGGFFDMGAFEYQGTECADGIDNDGDTYIDWPFDPGCTYLYDVSEYRSTECDDGADNDGDTFIDWPADPECGDIYDDTEDTTLCMDGIDNDGDTLTDYPADPGCENLLDNSEYGTNECDDGVDNDGDTLIDYPDDPECSNVIDLNENNWTEIGTGSASGGGISNTAGASWDPSLALDSSGYPVVAWQDNSSGNWEIYVKRWDGSAWVEIGAGSASGGGISNNSGNSLNASIALDSSGYPVVAWDDRSSGNVDIYIKRWNGNAWEDIGVGSSSGGGISNSVSSATSPSLALDSSGFPVVAWDGYNSGQDEIYIKRWDGDSWVEIGTGSASGGGISNNGGYSEYSSLALDSSGFPVVAWEDRSSGNDEIYIKRWNGIAWEDIGAGSSSGGGISNDSQISEFPSLALDPTDYPIVAWRSIGSFIDDIYIKRWNGSAWEDVGAGSSSGKGISNTSGRSANPSLAVETSGYPVVAWEDNSTGSNEIYIKRWNGSAWEDIGTASSSGGGISINLDYSNNPSLAISSSDIPVVAWRDITSSRWEIYIRHWEP